VQASETLEYLRPRGDADSRRYRVHARQPVERIYREVRVNAIGGGSEEIMRDLAARQYGLADP
jgi:acyl-CoA dehydrogenase